MVNAEKAKQEYEIPYRQEGDFLLPDLVLDDTTDRPIGKYGRMRKEYLRNNKRGFYSALLLSSKLMEHLADVQEEASEKIQSLMDEMLKNDPPPDKATDQMGWVRHMESTHMMAEGVIIREFVFEESGFSINEEHDEHRASDDDDEFGGDVPF